MKVVALACTLSCIAAITHAQTPPAVPAPPKLDGVETVLGRWDLTVVGPLGRHTSWVEIERSGSSAVVGRFVGRIGSARPVGSITWQGGVARFTIPAQWEWTCCDLRVELRPVGDSLVGTIVRPDGLTSTFVGRKAPALLRPAPKAWTTPTPLFNGRDLSGWTVAPTARDLPSHWQVRNGVLANTEVEGANLMTVQRFDDFKLHVEFGLPARATSGVFPRGRYWVTLRADPDPQPSKATTGAVRNFLLPSENATLGPDVWQTIDITLVGRRITTVVNGKTVMVDQTIPGLTGSAIDADEGAAGPIMLQGEEQLVEFRNITISVPRSDADSSATPGCADQDSSAAAAAVRQRLATWVRQANASDGIGMSEVWAPKMVGWFPSAPLFSDSTARALAGVRSLAEATGARATLELRVDDIVASGSVVAVHDVWTETRTLGQPQRTVRRTIRGSELWRCQPDGRWRIARYVSAPEPWELVPR